MLTGVEATDLPHIGNVASISNATAPESPEEDKKKASWKRRHRRTTRAGSSSSSDAGETEFKQIPIGGTERLPRNVPK